MLDINITIPKAISVDTQVKQVILKAPHEQFLETVSNTKIHITVSNSYMY